MADVGEAVGPPDLAVQGGSLLRPLHVTDVRANLRARTVGSGEGRRLDSSQGRDRALGSSALNELRASAVRLESQLPYVATRLPIGSAPALELIGGQRRQVS